MSRPVTTLLAAWILVTPCCLACGGEPRTEPGPNRADEPLAPRLSLHDAARFLDRVAGDWTERRQCGACHTNYAYLLARPSLKGFEAPEPVEVLSFFEGRVAGWDGAEPGAKPRWPAEVVATAATLAIHDARTSGKLREPTRKALDRMWTLQRPDGAFDWLKCNWPPYEHDDDYGVVFAALGVGMAPEGYKDTPAARKGLEGLVRFLREHPAPSLHHQAFRLWASKYVDGLMTDDAKQETVRSLLARQRPDGGWNLASLGDWKRRDDSPNDPEGPADGYGTGFVVFILREAGVPADDASIRRGVDWLKTHQRASGRWFTRSVTNDKDHYITHAGTVFAVMALEACGVTE